MKRKTVIIIAILILMALTGRNALEYANAEDREPLSEMIVATFDVESLKVDDKTEVLVIVQGNNEEVNTTGKLFVYTREQGSDGKMSGWKDAMVGINVKMGKKGMGKTREGDKKTPVGMYELNTPFGINGSKEGFPENYLKVTDSMYWNGDSSSPTYNRLVDRDENTDFDPEESEHLIDEMPKYNYALNISYNSRCVPDAGSAIFLQCHDKDKNFTGGSIAMKEDDMLDLMGLYREGKTKILIDNAGEFTKYN